MATTDQELLITAAEKLEQRSQEALNRGLEFATIAHGDPDAALADFISAGALSTAAGLCRAKADQS